LRDCRIVGGGGGGGPPPAVDLPSPASAVPDAKRWQRRADRGAGCPPAHMRGRSRGWLRAATASEPCYAPFACCICCRRKSCGRCARCCARSRRRGRRLACRCAPGWARRDASCRASGMRGVRERAAPFGGREGLGWIARERRRSVVRACRWMPVGAPRRDAMRRLRAAAHCNNALQRAAARCNALQRTATTHCNAL
jgi:hypothetical protein